VHRKWCWSGRALFGAGLAERDCKCVHWKRCGNGRTLLGASLRERKRGMRASEAVRSGVEQLETRLGKRDSRLRGLEVVLERPRAFWGGH
jgi:hypothetical protein